MRKFNFFIVIGLWIGAVTSMVTQNRHEKDKLYNILEACCLEHIGTFSRRYITLEETLLHCLNGFNENAAIPNHCQSLQDYFLQVYAW